MMFSMDLVEFEMVVVGNVDGRRLMWKCGRKKKGAKRGGKRFYGRRRRAVDGSRIR